MTALQYPIGKFQFDEVRGAEMHQAWMQEIADFPTQVRTLVAGVDEAHLAGRYRPRGWSLRQLVHHCADSHMNGFIRFRLALTEDNPTIKPYLQAPWSALPDAEMPVEVSLQILEGMHARWSYMLRQMSETDFLRTYYHPEDDITGNLERSLALYAWHGKHHLAHMKLALENPYSA